MEKGAFFSLLDCFRKLKIIRYASENFIKKYGNCSCRDQTAQTFEISLHVGEDGMNYYSELIFVSAGQHWLRQIIFI